MYNILQFFIAQFLCRRMTHTIGPPKEEMEFFLVAFHYLQANSGLDWSDQQAASCLELNRILLEFVFFF